MKLNFIPNLQRDAMAWDSGQVKSQKYLNIANIDKLVGAVTGPVSSGWVCAKAAEYPQTYDMLFNSMDINNITMDVRVLKEAQGWNVRGINYIVEIRQLVKSPNTTNAYYHSKPTAYGIDETILKQPKTFANWLDNKLTAKRIAVADELWKQTPWYDKIKSKVKSYINNWDIIY